MFKSLRMILQEAYLAGDIDPEYYDDLVDMLAEENNQ